VFTTFNGAIGSGAPRLAGVGRTVVVGLSVTGGVSTGLVSLAGTTGMGAILGTEGVTFSSTGGEGSFLSTRVLSLTGSSLGAGTEAISGSRVAGGS